MRSCEVELLGIEPRTEDDSWPSLAGIFGNKKHRILLLKTTVTLTLGIMGGIKRQSVVTSAFFAFTWLPFLCNRITLRAILPLSWGFQQTGILWGFIIMVAVSFANDYTCGLLLRQAEVFGAHDYESLSLSIGGQFYKYFTEFAIIILLLGSIVGAILQCGEAGSIGLEDLSSQVPHWLIDRSGSLLMAFVTVFIAYPLCHYSKLQEVMHINLICTPPNGLRLRAYDKIVVVLEHGPAVNQWEFTSIGLGLIPNVSAFQPLSLRIPEVGCV